MIQCKRLCQLDKSGWAPPDKVIMEVAQPKAIAKYYNGAGTIDQHNRIRTNKLRMDRNLTTKDWAKRFNLRVLGIICINAYLFYQQVVCADNRTTSCLEFFERLADKLVDNQEGIGLTWAAAEQDVGAVAGRRRSNAKGQEDYSLQATQQGETSCARELRLQGMHEAIHLRL